MHVSRLLADLMLGSKRASFPIPHKRNNLLRNLLETYFVNMRKETSVSCPGEVLHVLTCSKKNFALHGA